MSAATQELIDRVFTFHPANSEKNQPERYEELRTYFRQLATWVNQKCPESREKSLAITHLQEAMMFAVASIAVNE